MTRPSDAIRLRGLVFFTHAGCSAEERKLGQHLEIDVELRLDLRAAGEADAIARTLDYAKVYEAVRGAVEGKEFFLLEAVAQRAADAALSFGAAEATVRVRKPRPPIRGAGEIGCAEVEIHRP